MAAFDVATAVSAFVADSACTSIELPPLTTGQRKNTKALIMQHPELRCESYGFGNERRLHLFKIGYELEAPQPATESAPPQDGTTDRTLCDSWPIYGRENMPLPVRNTFIHIESVPADERAVQSMPHGMFRQCMLLETTCKPSGKVADDTAPVEVCETEFDRTPSPSSEPEAEPTAQAGQRMPLGLGALVVVEGLTKLPAFNGLSAVVQGFDHASGRYSIMLVTANGACHQAKIKEENLRLLMPCP